MRALASASPTLPRVVRTRAPSRAPRGCRDLRHPLPGAFREARVFATAGPRSSSSSSSSSRSSSDRVLDLQREALESATKLKLAALRAQKEEQRLIQARARELEKELAIRAEGRRAAEARGGRRPTQRVCLPIALAGAQCAALALASFVATSRLANDLANDLVARDNRVLLVNLVAGGGVALTALLVFSAGVLFAVAWNEGWGVVKNTPVTFYRCDGMGHDCCKNGPHGLGAHPRFAYLSDGRGFETRQKDSMRRHLLRSRRCRELKPVVVYPKEEGWKLF